jgi:hypothetical protein
MCVVLLCHSCYLKIFVSEEVSSKYYYKITIYCTSNLIKYEMSPCKLKEQIYLNLLCLCSYATTYEDLTIIYLVMVSYCVSDQRLYF